MPKPLDETALLDCIARLRAGDEAAFGDFYGHFHARLYRFSLRFLKVPELAEEITQDVFVKVWEMRWQLDANRNVESFLFTVTKNLTLNLLEKASREERLRQEIGLHLYKESLIDGSPDDLNSEKRLHEVILKLPAQRQTVLRLSKFDGMSYEAIGQQLGISKGTVSDHLVKALRFLRANLQIGGLALLLGNEPW